MMAKAKTAKTTKSGKDIPVVGEKPAKAKKPPKKTKAQLVADELAEAGELLKRIEAGWEAVKKAEAELIARKIDARMAKEALGHCQGELNRLIGARTEQHPLLDSAVAQGKAKIEAEKEKAATGGQKMLPLDDDQLIGKAKEIYKDDEYLIHGDELTLIEDVFDETPLDEIAGGREELRKAITKYDAWKAKQAKPDPMLTPIGTAIPNPSLAKKLEDNGIKTVGDLAKFTAAHGEHWVTDLAGVGPAAAEKIDGFMLDFWKRNPRD